MKGENHDYKLLDDAFTEYVAEISQHFQPMEEQLTKIDASLIELEACAVYNQTFPGRQEVNQLYCVTQGKLKELAIQKDEAETAQILVKNLLSFMRESVAKDKY